ncbi:hypothetical protein HPP92_002116 [Vanilla planifolia]|uniref:Uncharacterized protein n=1 Tax=Vanilla planifolia TaxID=51239 RepID=A0A835RVT3_VANPL|nr:hypothetical protein HPP92_002389 [Vanilla planifolia]KAG0502044.1 hypothetical protein HPP92_002116 [Vanilla planifolia]
MPAASLSSTSDNFPPEAPALAPSANGAKRASGTGGEGTGTGDSSLESVPKGGGSKLQQDLKMEQQKMGFMSELEVRRHVLNEDSDEFFKLKLGRSSTSAGRCGEEQVTVVTADGVTIKPRSNNGEEKILPKHRIMARKERSPEWRALRESANRWRWRMRDEVGEERGGVSKAGFGAGGQGVVPKVSEVFICSGDRS